ncbi:DUF2237 family protein [Aquimarina agarivorans]|uniref:DUF2237 family protein n=1 Tax=Aquimarina agarivorans TaxID=980584 RepID=UPI000248F633|nr:DUF2237 domain-containing protein [Aquimarina agarivorans]
MALNVLGSQLQPCCFAPKTGYFRDGFCKTTQEDTGTHIICAIMTSEFLNFTKSKGNDLSTPIPHWQFPGLKAGDKWCLCISRWLEALKYNVAPPVLLSACQEKALDYVTLDVLKQYDFVEN